MQCISFLAFLVKGGEKNHYITPLVSWRVVGSVSACWINQVAWPELCMVKTPSVTWLRCPGICSLLSRHGAVSPACVLPALRPLGSLWHPVCCPSGGPCSPPQLHTRYRTRAPPKSWCWSCAASQRCQCPRQPVLALFFSLNTLQSQRWSTRSWPSSN